MSLREIPSDVISNLGEYMTNQELFHRRGSDRLWDVEYQRRRESMTSPQLDREIRLAIESDDVEYLQELGINATARQLMLARDNGSFRVGRALLDIWARTPILDHSVDYSAIDLARSIPVSIGLNDAILDKILTIFGNGISLYLQMFGLVDVSGLINLGMIRRLRSNQYLIELLKTTVNGEPSDNWIDEITLISEMIRARGGDVSDLMDAIDSYYDEASRITRDHQRRMSNIVNRM